MTDPHPTLPFVRHSDTSREAAESVKHSSSYLRDRVYTFLRSMPGGATDEQVQRALDMPANTERPRRVELVAMGLVEKSGERRKGESGRSASVWRVKRA